MQRKRHYSHVAAAALATVSTAGAATYYISPTGNNSSAGTSAGTAWKTTSKLNNFTFQAGDSLLFQGGQTFTGNLWFEPTTSGATHLNGALTIGSYGTGTATLNAGNYTGIYVHNYGQVTINNLNITGSGSSSASTADGISFYNDLPGNVKLNNVALSNLNISGFGHDGIAIGGYNGTSGYNNVSVTNSNLHDNSDAGLVVYGPTFNLATPNYANSNVYVGHVKAWNNTGRSGVTSPTGNGIMLSSVNGATIERSVAYDNGANNTSDTGPVGIWAYDANNVTIQFNESHHNRNTTTATTGGDGDGFDFDQNVTHSVMQYNYSHDNDGAGYLLYHGLNTAGSHDNVIRYNVSENDGRTHGYSGIYVGGRMTGIEMYNNTVYYSSGATGSNPAAIKIASAAGNTPYVNFRNNIIMTTGGARLVVSPASSNVLFQGNDYWTSGGAFLLRWGSTNYATLQSWLDAVPVQERLNSTILAKNLDPLLQAAGTGGTIGDADLLAAMTAYKLLANSSLVNSGLDLHALFGIDVGLQDFYGNPIPTGGGFDLGASDVPEPGMLTIVGLAGLPFLRRRRWDVATANCGTAATLTKDRTLGGK